MNSNIIILHGTLLQDLSACYRIIREHPACIFTMLTSCYYQGRTYTSEIKVVAWRDLADYLRDYFEKGDTVIINGFLSSNSSQDKQTTKALFVTATDVKMVCKNPANAVYVGDVGKRLMPDLKSSLKENEKTIDTVIQGD